MLFSMEQYLSVFTDWSLEALSIGMILFIIADLILEILLGILEKQKSSFFGFVRLFAQTFCPH